MNAQTFTKVIVQYAKEGNQQALQGLLSQSLNDQEKIIINALLESDGTLAAKAYQSLIEKNPSSPFVQLADSRLKEYNLSISGGNVTPTKPTINESNPANVKSTDTKPIEPANQNLTSLSPTADSAKPTNSNVIRFSIQFASFNSRSQAEALQKQLQPKVKTRIVEIDDGTGKYAFKVRSEKLYESKTEATINAKLLKLDYYVVSE